MRPVTRKEGPGTRGFRSRGSGLRLGLRCLSRALRRWARSRVRGRLFGRRAAVQAAEQRGTLAIALTLLQRTGNAGRVLRLHLVDARLTRGRRVTEVRAVRASGRLAMELALGVLAAYARFEVRGAQPVRAGLVGRFEAALAVGERRLVVAWIGGRSFRGTGRGGHHDRRKFRLLLVAAACSVACQRDDDG